MIDLNWLQSHVGKKISVSNSQGSIVGTLTGGNLDISADTIGSSTFFGDIQRVRRTLHLKFTGLGETDAVINMDDKSLEMKEVK